jgi:predicted metal-dependent hydrolase
VPQYWFADNPIVTHMENAFSLLIPPGERFFIRSVRNYEDRAADPEFKDLIRAFIEQEGLHTRAHNEFNARLKRFGVDVQREIAYANRVFAWMQKVLPKKVQLGVTVFLEHLTATGAHMLFTEPVVAESMHPQALRFWRWHAAEELEHKAVAFDLFEQVGGGYLLRIFSAMTAVLLLALPLHRIARRMMKEDPTAITSAMRQQARDLNRKVMQPQLRMIGQYFKPGFHPWDVDDLRHLEEWYASPEGIWNRP